MARAGVDLGQSSSIRSILDSYHHTNALALVCLSAFCARFGLDESTGSGSFSTTSHRQGASSLHHEPLPPLPSLKDAAPSVRGLIYELNTFGEDSDPELVASMYRHLSYWPAYLSLIRALLIPFHVNGQLTALTSFVRLRGEAHGRELARFIPAVAPIADTGPVLAAVTRFVRHPIARMTAVCAILREVTPE